ncbi:hypothetical protein ACROYT_G003828 [Oculina patagonica]
MGKAVWTFYFWINCMIVGYGSTCDPPTPPYGSTIIYPSNQGKHASGSVVLFGCKQGFYLVGKPIIRCTGNTWTQSQFSCVGFCPDQRHIPNGQVVPASPNVGQAAVEFRCNIYFRLIGSPRLECINGRWNGMVPFCEKLRSCVPLRAPANGTLHGTDTTHGAKASFSCLTAYCLKIRDPPNGRKFGTRFSHGRVVSFECKTGYQLIGDRAVRCIHGRWNSTIPVCKAMLCSKPAIPSNSYIIHPQSNKVNFTHGTHVFLACRDGYYLKGTPIMVCNQTVWVKKEFSCIASCPAVLSIKNGIITHVTLKEGGEIGIKCRTNYTLVGSPKLRCINGGWNDSLPSCKAPCPDPGHSYQGNRIGDDFRHGKTVTFTCPRNYIMTGARTIKCSNGRWSNAKPICKAPCDKLVAPAHGRRHGRSMRFYCSYGYASVGASSVTCNDGNWDNPAPVCKGVCSRPRTPSSGRLHGNKARFIEGDEVRFSCDSNYDLFGNAKLRCVGRNWDSREPVCKGQCTFDGNPDNGFTTNGVFWNGQSLPHGTNVKYACDVKYTLVGSNVRHCDDGSWNTSLPSCKGTCKNPRQPKNGKIIGNDFGYDSSINFVCNSGYDLRGPASLTCKQGAWNGGMPECKKRCKDPGDPLNGYRFGVNYTHGGAVQFRCKDGPFDLVGASWITCDEGEWSHPIPSCEARCSDPGSPVDGTKEGNDYRSRANVTYRCNPPLELIGSRVIVCQNGKWSDSRPTCSSCARPLGLENNKKLDIIITSPASSINAASAARLNGPSAWCPSRQSYLQIDLGKNYKLTAIATQGGTRLNRWVKKYRISFKAGAKTVTYIESGSTKDIDGNKDASSPVKYKFKEPFVTSTVWIYPLSVNNGPVCLRTELYGCDPTSDCILVGSMVWGLWAHNDNAFNYYPAYVTKLNATHVDFVLILGADYTRSYNRTEQVLIVNEIPKQTDISVNTTVIAQHRSDKKEWYRSGTIVGFPGDMFASVRFDDACDLPLGMEDKRIEDRQISAEPQSAIQVLLSNIMTTIQVSSTSWARLNGPYGWCANIFFPFIQVDFHKTTRITAVETQGSEYHKSWVTRYSLKYKQSGNKFVWYKESHGQKSSSSPSSSSSSSSSALSYLRHVVVRPSKTTKRHLDSLLSPEMAEKANLGKESSPSCEAEVVRCCAVGADGSSLAYCSLLLGLTGPAFLCCLGSFGDALAPGGSVGGKRLPELSADVKVF